MKEATLKALIGGGAVEGTRFRRDGDTGAWVLWVRYGGHEEALENDRGAPRRFKRETTAVAYLMDQGLPTAVFDLTS